MKERKKERKKRGNNETSECSPTAINCKHLFSLCSLEISGKKRIQK